MRELRRRSTGEGPKVWRFSDRTVLRKWVQIGRRRSDQNDELKDCMLTNGRARRRAVVPDLSAQWDFGGGGTHRLNPTSPETNMWTSTGTSVERNLQRVRGYTHTPRQSLLFLCGAHACNRLQHGPYIPHPRRSAPYGSEYPLPLRFRPCLPGCMLQGGCPDC